MDRMVLSCVKSSGMAVVAFLAEKFELMQTGESMRYEVRGFVLWPSWELRSAQHNYTK